MEITHGDESQVGYYIGLMVRSMNCMTGRCALNSSPLDDRFLYRRGYHDLSVRISDQWKSLVEMTSLPTGGPE